MRSLLSSKKLLVILLCVALSFFAVPVLAETVTQDGLAVTVSTDKGVYADGDTINLSVEVRNTTSETVNNLMISVVDGIPYGYIEGAADNCNIGTLGGNRSSTATINLLPLGLPLTGDATPIALLIGLCVSSAAALFLLGAQSRRRMMCMLLALAMVGAMLPSRIASADEGPYSGCFDVTKDITVGENTTQLKIRISYQYSNRIVTRGEWIEALVSHMDMKAEYLTENQYYYRDSLDSRYGKAVETAELYGILPPPEGVEDPDQDIPFFNPELPATREFAAYTAVLACGFTGEYYADVSAWNDLSSLKYPDQAVIAVLQGFMALDENQCFAGSRILSRREMAAILSGIDALQASANIDEYYDNTVYVDGVIRDELMSLETYSVRELGNGEYEVRMPVTEGTALLTEGTVFVLPAIEEYYQGLALKVRQVKQQGDVIVVRGTAPELAEVVEKIDVATCGIPLVDQIAVGEDVQLEYIAPSASAQDDSLYTKKIEVEDTDYDWGTFKFKIPKKGVEIANNLEGAVDITIKLPEVKSKVVVDVDWFNTKVTEFLYQIKKEVEISANVEYTLVESGTHSGSGSQKLSDRKELGRIPFALGTTGLSVEIVFSYTYSAKGTIEISYTIEGYKGFQYKDGCFRFICDVDDNLSLLKIKAEAEARIEVGVELAFLKFWDIFGGYINVGIGLSATFMDPHITANGTLLCGDAHVALLSACGVNEEDIVGKFLKEVCHFTIKKDLLKNNDSNPHRLGVHVENFALVPKCTFGGGEIVGTVRTADSRLPIKDARIQLYAYDENFDTDSTAMPSTPVLRTKYTDQNGKYRIDNVDAGTYLLRVSATGYKTYYQKIELISSVTLYPETLMMVDRAMLTKTGDVSGTIRNAVTGATVSGVSYSVYNGWSIQSGEAVKAGVFSGSSYSVELPAGNYTLCYSKNGYTANYVNISIVAGQNNLVDLNLVPADSEGESGGGGILEYDQIRVVLTWGAYPRDLDSHMFGWNGSNVVHTYYSDKNAYVGGERVINLDLDDTTSYGPETTTVYKVSACDSFSYYVHDYTNRRSTTSAALSNSGARVQVYYGNVLVNSFYVPEGNFGTVWHVFDYDVTSSELTPVNTFHYSANAGSLGVITRDGSTDLRSDDAMIRMIHNATLEEK